MVIESSEVQGSESIFLFGVHQLPSPGQNLLYGPAEQERLTEMEEFICASPAQELSMSMFNQAAPRADSSNEEQSLKLTIELQEYNKSPQLSFNKVG